MRLQAVQAGPPLLLFDGVDVTREQAEANVLAMIPLGWTIRDGNLDERTNTKLPTYLDPVETGKKEGDQEFGIPYCKGGN